MTHCKISLLNLFTLCNCYVFLFSGLSILTQLLPSPHLWDCYEIKEDQTPQHHELNLILPFSLLRARNRKLFFVVYGREAVFSIFFLVIIRKIL